MSRTARHHLALAAALALLVLHPALAAQELSPTQTLQEPEQGSDGLLHLKPGAQETPPSPEFKSALARAKLGDAAAAFEVFRRYSTGDGVELDAEAGRAWLDKALDGGNADAEVFKARLVETGQDGLKEAAGWYAKAAGHGKASAQYWLGLHYSVGAGLPQDDAQAASWFHKAEAQGYGRASGALGGMYQDGRGVTQDLDEARKWFAKYPGSSDGCVPDGLKHYAPEPFDADPSAPPQEEEAKALAWAASTVKETLSFTPDNANTHFRHSVARLFSDKGLASFLQAVLRARIIENAQALGQTSRLESSGPASVLRFGRRDGAELWIVNVPATEYFVGTGGTSLRADNLLVQVVMRAPQDQPEEFRIDQWIASPADGCPEPPP